MNLGKLRISRRTVTIAVAFAGLVSLAIGAHAALNKRSLDAAKAIGTEHTGSIGTTASRVALVIGNGHYPDASAPLAQPINDARGLTAALRAKGFDVDVVEDATKDDMARAIVRLKAKIKPDTVAMLFFGGYGVQVGRESFMIPVDAAIWKEADVRRDGVSIEQVLDAMTEKGAKAKLVVVDASRRNPYERRFRSYSHGLAPISTPENALILTSATPGKVADDGKGQYSVLVTELLEQFEFAVRRRQRLQQDPHLRLPRLRRRAGAAGVVVPAGRRPHRRVRPAIRHGIQNKKAPAEAGAFFIVNAVLPPAVCLLRIRARRHRPHRIALAQQRAGARHHDVALSQPRGDLDLSGRHQPGLHPPRFDARAPHHLHHGAGGAIEDGGERHRDAAALPGLDLRAAAMNSPAGGGWW